MKNLLTLSLLMGALVLASCKKDEDFAPVGEAYNLYDPAALQGKWTLNKVIQSDLVAINKGFPVEVQTLDLTPLFPVSKYQIEFKAEGGRITSFQASELTAPEDYVPTMWNVTRGKVAFRDVYGTTSRALQLQDENGVTDATLEFGQLFKPAQNTLVLRYTRRQADGTAIAAYDYTFTR